MTFTYSGTLTDNTEWVRFTIGDTVSAAGPRPGSTSNYTDEEIDAVITDAGTKGRAAAFLCETLATEWAAYAGSVSMADYSENLTARADYFMKRAADLRKQYGGTRAAPTQVAPTRVDGFSDDVDAEET